MKRLFVGPLLLSIAVFLFQACSSGPEPQPEAATDTPADASAPAPRCVVDPARVAARGDCLTDDQCPCGTHCDLGVCEASCSANEGCAQGERCDLFGRCRAAGETALVPQPPRSRKTGRLRAVESSVAVDPTNGQGLLRFVVEGEGAERLRVRAHDETEVQCPSGEWATECLLTAVPGDRPSSLPVRRAGGASGMAAIGQVSLFVEGGREFVSVRFPGPKALRAMHTPLAGTYAGTGTVDALGVGAELRPGEKPADVVGLPFAAKLYGTEDAVSTIELSDPYGALTSAGSLVGVLAISNPDGDGAWAGTAAFPIAPFIASDLGAALPYSVLAETLVANVTIQDEPRVLTIELVQRYLGLGARAVPTVRWQLLLSRTGDVTGVAPAVPADATQADPATLATTPTPWEAAFDSSVPDWSSSTDTERHSRYGFLHGAYGLDSCAQLEATGNAAARMGLGLRPGFGGSFDRGALGGPPADSLFSKTEPLAVAIRERLEPIGTAAKFHSVTLTSVDLQWTYPLNQDFASNRFPCLGNFFAGDISGLGRFAGTGGEAWFFACAELERLTGCETRPITGNVREASHAVGWNVSYTDTAGALHQNVPAGGTVNVRWFNECVLPETQVHCASAAACVEPSSAQTPDSLASSLFGKALGSASGDAQCATGARSGAIDLDALSDKGTPPTAKTGFEGCLKDLALLRAGPPAHSGKYGQALSNVMGKGACVDPARLVLATRWGLESARGATPDDLPRLEAGAYALRLLGRWLQMHAFFAAEAVQREQMASVFAGTEYESPDLEQMLSDSLGGWDLLFHPRFANAVGAAPAPILAQPDYRLYVLGLAGRNADSQRNGLPAIMVDTLSKQAELLARVVEKGSYVAAQDVPQKVRKAMPRLMVARALAYGLLARAKAVDPALPWADRFAGAERRLATKVASAVHQARAIAEGLNPLGIEDDDLPLYFLADEASGPGGRFSAISDFLLGTGPGSNAWAPALVRQASDALAQARTAYVDQVDRAYQADVDARDHQRWVGDVRDDYNAQLREYCGPIAESLIDDPSFNAASCPTNAGDPACAIDANAWYGTWTEADVLGRHCLSQKLGGTGFVTPEAQAFFSKCLGDTMPTAAPSGWSAVQIGPSGLRIAISCKAKPELGVMPLFVGTLEVKPPASEVDATNAGDPGQPSIFRTYTEECHKLYPTMRLSPPLPQSFFETPGCVRGSLGEAYLDIVTAARNVKLAQESSAEHLQAYNIALMSCHLLEQGEAAQQRLREAHATNMRNLREAKAAVDSIATAAGAVKDCTATVAGSSKDTPWAAISGGLAAGASCIAGGVEMGANLASINLQTAMDHAQEAHDNAAAHLDAQTQIKICFNDARQELVGMRTAALNIEQATFDLKRAQAAVNEEIADAQRIWADGSAYLKEIETFKVRPATGDVWMNEHVSTYVRRFKLARRATYLAVRAVEYELQQSLTLGADVLAAAKPDDLEAVLTELWTTAGTRTVHGARPSDLHVVLSLKDDVLRVGDESRLPAELRPLSPAERFRMLLSSKDYAQYDNAGRYLGQRVPFTLAPLGAFGFDVSGVPLYATRDCAERVWSVNASVLGTGMHEGTGSTFVRLDLLKKNTFFSQWCGDVPSGAPFQSASVRPTRNLFREPGVGVSVGTQFGTQQSTSGESTARIQAFMGVDRAALEEASYASGQTSELAARGLFGEYALFFPAEILAEETPSGAYTAGLVLDRVDDVLLRLDYVSVARSCVPACSHSGQCDDQKLETFDTCSSPGTCQAACQHTPVACFNDAGCDDSDPKTLDFCASAGLPDSWCQHCAPSCMSAADCDDANPLTDDFCSGAGTCKAVCTHAKVRCAADADCDDGDPCTVESCQSSACSHSTACPGGVCPRTLWHCVDEQGKLHPHLRSSITQQLDPVEGSVAVIELTTLVVRPYTVKPVTATVPAGMSLVAIEESARICPDVWDSRDCRQRFRLLVDTGTLCRVDGAYQFLATYECPAGNDCSKLDSAEVPPPVAFALKGADFCTEHGSGP